MLKLIIIIIQWLYITKGEVLNGYCSGSQEEYFPNIPKISYEGPDSQNLLAYHYYNANEIILGKPMKEWFKFSVAFWHTFRGDGSDPFGSPTKKWPWENQNISEMEKAKKRMEANFEFMKKLGISYWCFHDRDIAPEGLTLKETNENLDIISDFALNLQNKTEIRVLWGTAQLFKNPRYMHGAATSPDANVFAFAAAQVKKAMEITKKLSGRHFTFWGGREGYHTLLNTDLKLELENLSKFMKMAVEYKKKIGLEGELFIEPKPQEPTKHQYDWDSATTTAFLLKNNLENEFKLNIECNHATLSGHSCEHELLYTSINNLLGNIDINTGDAQTGWDTDQFLTDITEATKIMRIVVKNGGLLGGFNFDAKLRRESIDVEDLFYAHIGSMDALARGLRNVAKIIEDGKLDSNVEDRYKSYSSGIGLAISENKVDFESLEAYTLENEDPVENIKSGSAEKYEMMLNMFIN